MRHTTKGKNANYRPTNKGAGMTYKGVTKYRKEHPGSNLKPAVTTPPSKLKRGSKKYKRRIAFCSRTEHTFTGPRGRAARRRWHC